MRILVVHPGPDFSVHDVYAGWMDSLKKLVGPGHVMSYNLNDRLIFYNMALIDSGEVDETGHKIVKSAMTPQQAFAAAMQGLSHACYTFWPDVVLFVSGFFLNAGTMQLLRERRHKLVILHTESPYQDEEQLMRGQLAHLNLLNDPTNLKRFEQYTLSAYMPHAYRPDVHYPRTGPLNPELAADLAFIGTAFKSRVEFFSSMDLTGLDVLLGGNDWGSVPEDSPLAPFVGTGLGNPDCVNNDEAAEVYRHAKAGLNLYRRETEEGGSWHGYAMGPREVEMAASGLFFLRDPRGEGDEVLPMLPTFASPEDASEQLKWWLAHDRERQLAADKARLAIADRTFDANAKQMLRMLDKI